MAYSKRMLRRMNERRDSPTKTRDDRPREASRRPAAPPATSHKAIRPRGLWLLGLGALLPLAAGLAYGAWQHNAQHRQV